MLEKAKAHLDMCTDRKNVGQREPYEVISRHLFDASKDQSTANEVKSAICRGASVINDLDLPPQAGLQATGLSLLKKMCGRR